MSSDVVGTHCEWCGAEYTAPAPPAVETGFARIVCGVDGTREGFEAARQAARLTSRHGQLDLVAVVDLYDALAGRWGAEPARRHTWDATEGSIEQCFADLRVRAQASLDLASDQVRGRTHVATRAVDGSIHVQLLAAVEAAGADLLVVGTHGGHRLTGAALGEATAIVLHDAPISVLVARPPFDPGRFPATIVAGTDGSPEGARALEVAEALRERSGGQLTVVTAAKRPVDELVDAARTADLLVVGSRGLRGAKSLGSVSERVAHRSPSSVLVVRAAQPLRAEAPA